MCKHIMSVRLGCPLWTKKTNKQKKRKRKSVTLIQKRIKMIAEQQLTIEVRLERRPEKTSYKKTIGQKKQEIWVGTMAHAPAIGSLSYGGFTKVRVSIVQ